MKVISFNANGIRAAGRKGFFQWLEQQQADFVCIQETKAQQHQLTDALYHPEGYHCFYHDAEKKGYSGVAIYSKHKPDQVINSFGMPLADQEGRYLQVDVGSLSIISLYLPSGSSGEARQKIKYQMMADFERQLITLNQDNRQVIICGDWNIVHKEIDIRNWRSNQKNSGCLPEERAWLDKVFGSLNYVDAFRAINQQANQYTWWSNRGAARQNNVGWRIDYQVITPNLKPLVESEAIYTDQNFSDHAPLVITYNKDC